MTSATKRPAWLNDPTRYHDRGDIDFGSCNQICFEQGDFFGLDDLFTEQPAVVDGLAQIYSDWIRRFRVDGFRIDTARHVNAGFFRLWVPRIRAAARAGGAADFPIFGEIVLRDAVELSTYVRRRGLPEVLDFPFQDAAVGFAGGDSSGNAIADRLRDDDYFRGPSGVAPTPPTFLGNHDMGRAALEIQQHAHVGGDELLRRVLLGYDLLYLLRGAPVVYYGDEVGMIGRGGDQQARQDMFPTQVDEWRRQERVGSPPVGNGSSFDVGNPIQDRLRTLGAIRDLNPAFSVGSSIVRSATRNLLVVSRVDPDARREYVVAFNSSTTNAHVSVPTSTPSSAWAALLGDATASSTANGTLEFDVPPLATKVLVPLSPAPTRAAAAPRIGVAADNLSNFWRVSASVPDVTVAVTFAVGRANKGWQRLAVDDSPPYRAFLDPTLYRRKERIQLVAVARGLDGSTAQSRVVRFTVRPR